LEGNGGIGGNHPAFDILAPKMVTSSSTSGPTFDILAPSNGDILQRIRAHVPPFNAVCGEDNGGRADKRGARRSKGGDHGLVTGI
jgi:hypothetical protein